MSSPRPAHDVEIAYLTAVQSEALRSANLAQRLFLWKVLLTSVTLALAGGVIGTGEDLELTGLHFKLKLWVLLVVGCLMAFFILVLDFAQYERAHRLGWRAAQLYGDLGYRVPQEDLLRPDSPFGMPHVAAFQHEAAYGRRVAYPWLSAILWAFAGMLLVTTQAIVGARLVADFGWRPLPCAFLLLPVVTFVLGALRLHYTRKEALEGKRPWHRVVR
jgi:cytochrome c oxidase assembly factor CtaG